MFLQHEVNLGKGLVAGCSKARDGRQTVFFSTLNPLGQDDEEEEYHDRLDVARKFDYCSKWRYDQDVVFCITLKEAQDLGLEFWQTKSNAVIVYQTLPKQCIFRVVHTAGRQCTKDHLIHNRHPRLCSKKLVGWCNRSSKSSALIKALGIPSNQLVRKKMKEDIITSMFNKIDVRMDGIPENEILEDEKQMKSISEIVEQLHITNYGENHVYSEEG